MKIRQKKNNQSGFTLAESLVAMLILLMVSAIVAAGIPVARNAYEKVTVTANAQVALSTAISALRDEIGTARGIEINSTNNKISYYSSKTGNKSELYLKADDGNNYKIWLDEYVDYRDSTESKINEVREAYSAAVSRSLISDLTAGKGLYVTFDSAEYDKSKGIITFKGLSVYRNGESKDKGDSSLADIGALDVKVVAPFSNGS